MICPSCGGKFPDDAPKCPYCGTLNYTGAEQEYLDKLDDIKDDLGELTDVSKRVYDDEIFLHVKKVLKKLSIIFTLIIILVVLPFALLTRSVSYDTEEELDELKLKMAQNQEAIDTLDNYYDAGDYEQLIICFDETQKASGYSSALYHWVHYDFVEQYTDYSEFLDFSESYDPDDEYDYHSGRAAGFRFLISFDHINPERTTFTEQELALFAGYREEVYAFITQELGVTDNQLEKLAEECYEEDDDYISISPIFDFIDSQKETNNF